MEKKKKYIIIVALVLISVAVTSLVVVSIMNSGNSKKYSVEKAETSTETIITNQEILFFGSSFTKGYKSGDESFVDYLEKIDSIYTLKIAENKSRIVGDNRDAYIPRLTQLSSELRPNLVMFELSPYDAKNNLKIGKLSDSYTIDSFDTTTLIGSLEYLVRYTEDTWRCPVMFYTCPYYEDEKYEEMIEALKLVCDKWNLDLLDLYNDSDTNITDKNKKSLYIEDDFCPSKAGYKDLILPKFEEFIKDFIE